MIQGGSSVVAVVGGDHQILSVLVGVAVSWVLNGGGVAVSGSVTMVAVTQAVDGVAVAGLSLTLANMVTTDVGVTMVGLVSNGVSVTITVTVGGVSVAGLSISLTLANMVTTDVGVTAIWVVSYGWTVAITVTDSMSNTVSVSVTITVTVAVADNTIGRLSFALLLCCHEGNQQYNDQSLHSG